MDSYILSITLKEMLIAIWSTLIFVWVLAFLAGHYRRKCKKLEKEILSLENTISILKLKAKDNL